VSRLKFREGFTAPASCYIVHVSVPDAMTSRCYDFYFFHIPPKTYTYQYECGFRRNVGAVGVRGDGDDVTIIKVSPFNTLVRTSNDTAIITCNYNNFNFLKFPVSDTDTVSICINSVASYCMYFSKRAMLKGG